MIARWRAFYGEHPLHLVAVLGCLALATYAALAVTESPSWPMMLLWFAGAIVAHDLVLFPLYAAADRVLQLVHGLFHSRMFRGVSVPRRAVNYIRVPLLGVGLTFLLFFPGIVRQGEEGVRAATGLDQEPYLTRWLLLCAAMFATSALAYLAAALLRRVQPNPSEGTPAAGQ